MSTQPAYTITPKILTLIEQIGEAIGRVEASGALQDLRLRRINRIRTIHGTLAMSGNSLSEEQVSAILEETWPSLPTDQATDQATDQETDQATDQVIDQAIDQVTDQAGDQVAALLAALRREPKTAAELMAELGLSHRPTFRKNYLRPAMEAGLVEMTRPESPTAKNQKYRRARRGK